MKVSSLRFLLCIAVALSVSSATYGTPGDKPDRTAPRIVLHDQQQPQEPEAPSEKKMSPREVTLMRGDIYMARKMYIEAAAVYQDLLREEPRNAELLNKIGVAYHLQSRMGDAKKYYKRALKADKTNANARNNLGMVEFHKKKYKNAAKEFNRAIKIDPLMATYHQNLFHAYWSMKKYENAIVAFQRAVALDPMVFERRSAGAGSVLQGMPIEERAAYYFFMAKSYAIVGDVDRCAFYLGKARDEGYVGMAQIPKDPAFAGVMENPRVMEILGIQPVAAGTPKP